MAAPRFLDLNAEVDWLYQLPLADFIRERNALAARVKAAQGAEAAAHIKTLVKPNLVAWVVNQLHWRHRTEFMALLVAGDDFRAAQQDRLGGGEVDMAPAARSRAATLDALLGHAAELLKEAGHAPAPDLRQRLQTTLDALATFGTGEAAPRHGRLTAEVAPPGFAALAAMLPAIEARPGAPAARRGAAQLTVVARRDRQKLEAGRVRAEAGLQEAQGAAREAAEALTRAEAAWQAARRAIVEAQRQLDEATTREQTTLAERDQRRRDVARAGVTVRDAERALEAATRALKD